MAAKTYKFRTTFSDGTTKDIQFVIPDKPGGYNLNYTLNGVTKSAGRILVNGVENRYKVVATLSNGQTLEATDRIVTPIAYITYRTGTLPTGVKSITAYDYEVGEEDIFEDGAQVPYGTLIDFYGEPEEGYNPPTFNNTPVEATQDVIGANYVVAGSIAKKWQTVWTGSVSTRNGGGTINQSSLSGVDFSRPTKISGVAKINFGNADISMPFTSVLIGTTVTTIATYHNEEGDDPYSGYYVVSDGNATAQIDATYKTFVTFVVTCSATAYYDGQEVGTSGTPKAVTLTKVEQYF